MKKAIILNYHLIDNQTYNFDAFGGIYAVTQKSFEQQMAFLNKQNIKVAPLNDIINGAFNEDFCVAITVDDGNPSDYNVVYPVVKQYGYVATFFLSIHNMGKNNVDWDNYQQMMENNFNVGSHGLTHRDLTTLETNDINNELLQSKLIIERNIGKCIKYFSLPFGMYNRKVIEMARKIGYSAILTTHFKLYRPSINTFLIDRWSIKRNTSLKDFGLIVQNKGVCIKKYHYISTFKKVIISGVGSTLTNKIYTIKNKHF